ncbi:hypothetical protein MPLDJ20_320069 [Mesorhizobium plurifarium]|uniref:Uncharacterized protein n=1 Tax=Mesorhizobium plurifarium TaxID=69974 RepID=A0A090FHR3_MESPL|nr:hypothetical protein MPLDJ20_320069 [Mesorhizobium plurifarium]
MPLQLCPAESDFATTSGLRTGVALDFESVRMGLRIAQPGAWRCVGADEFAAAAAARQPWGVILGSAAGPDRSLRGRRLS